MTPKVQLEAWLAGNAIHCEHGCTPDFACCKPELLAPFVVRQAFVYASEADRAAFLGSFLGAAIALAAKEAGRARNARIVREGGGDD